MTPKMLELLKLDAAYREGFWTGFTAGWRWERGQAPMPFEAPRSRFRRLWKKLKRKAK